MISDNDKHIGGADNNNNNDDKESVLADREKFESTFIDVQCIDCSRNVNVSQKYLVHKAELGEGIRCKDCREQYAYRTRHLYGA